MKDVAVRFRSQILSELTDLLDVTIEEFQSSYWFKLNYSHEIRKMSALSK